MLEGVSSFLTALKNSSPQLLTGIAVACAILLFSPAALVEKLGLTGAIQEYRPFFGIGLIGSVSILFAQLAWWSRQFILAPFRKRATDKARAALLYDLTADEKAYLLPYIQNGANTMYYSIQDGVVQGLNSKGILYQAASVGDMIDGFAYNLQPWARKLLSADTQLLEGAGPPPQTPRERMGLW